MRCKSILAVTTTAILFASIFTIGSISTSNDAHAQGLNKLVIVVQPIPRDRVTTEATELERFFDDI